MPLLSNGIVGNVGIGINNLAYKLSVNSELGIYKGAASIGYIGNSGNNFLINAKKAGQNEWQGIWYYNYGLVALLARWVSGILLLSGLMMVNPPFRVHPLSYNFVAMAA